MRVYQKHELTVKGSAIAVTADFVLDLYATFVDIDKHVALLYSRNKVKVMHDGLTFYYIVNTQDGPFGPNVQDDMLIKTWNFLYRALSTVHMNVHSELIDAWKREIEDKEPEPNYEEDDDE